MNSTSGHSFQLARPQGASKGSWPDMSRLTAVLFLLTCNLMCGWRVWAQFIVAINFSLGIQWTACQKPRPLLFLAAYCHSVWNFLVCSAVQHGSVSYSRQRDLRISRKNLLLSWLPKIVSPGPFLLWKRAWWSPMQSQFCVHVGPSPRTVQRMTQSWVLAKWLQQGMKRWLYSVKCLRLSVDPQQPCRNQT